MGSLEHDISSMTDVFVHLFFCHSRRKDCHSRGSYRESSLRCPGIPDGIIKAGQLFYILKITY